MVISAPTGCALKRLKTPQNSSELIRTCCRARPCAPRSASNSDLGHKDHSNSHLSHRDLSNSDLSNEDQNNGDLNNKDPNHVDLNKSDPSNSDVSNKDHNNSDLCNKDRSNSVEWLLAVFVAPHWFSGSLNVQCLLTCLIDPTRFKCLSHV